MVVTAHAHSTWTSMHPTISHGYVIACNKVTNNDLIAIHRTFYTFIEPKAQTFYRL